MAHGEDQQKITTTVKGILKKPHKDANKHSNLDDSLPVDQGTTAKVAIELVTDSSITETQGNATERFDSDDTEQPFASLTDEEKQIIGLMSPAPTGNNDLCTGKSSNAKITTVSNAANASSSNLHTSVPTNMAKENQGIVSSEQADVNTADTYKETQVEEVKNGSSGDSLICFDVQKNTTDKMPTDSGQECAGQTNDLIVAKEDAGELLSKERKSVQLKTPGLDVTSKKRRKSQSLPCVIDGFPTSSLEKCVKEDTKIKVLKGNEDFLKRETTLHQFLKSSSKLLEEIDCSMKKPSLGDDTTPREMTAHLSPLKKEKPVLDKAVSLKQKTPIKELPEENAHASLKKTNITETEINFFGPVKKASKSNKVDKEKKSKGKTPPVKTSKATKTEARGLEKSKDLKGKFSKGITILISDGSDTFSPPNCESSSEEDSHLKRIWDDFEPQTDSVVSKDSPSPLKTHSQSSSGKMMSPVAALTTDSRKQASLVNTLGLGKKQRVAHTANHVR